MKKFLLNCRYVWNPLKPLMMARVALNWFVSFFTIRLRYVDTSIGYRCNQNCAHCFNKTDKLVNELITPATVRKICDESMKLGACVFSFQGGEPLVYSNLFDYIKAARPSMNIISVSTNGLLLDDAMCKKLKRAGVDIVTISIDRHHKRTFQITTAIKHGLKVTVATMADEDLRSVENFCDQINSRMIVILPAAIGGFTYKDMLTDNKIKEVKNFCRKSKRASLDTQTNWHEFGCGAGKEILYITPDGNVKACPFLKRVYGNAITEGIKEIRERMLRKASLSTYNHVCIAGEGQGRWKEYI